MRLTSLLRRKSVTGSAFGCMFAASLWAAPAFADGLIGKTTESASESHPGWDVNQASERSIRLNYLPTPWSRVLQDVANKSGSTLVMHDVPPGKFSRHDWSKHDRKEAIQIINRELEPQGFRVLIKDQFLTVIKTKRNRLEYRRPVAPTAPEENVAATEKAVPPRATIQQAEHVEPVAQETSSSNRRVMRPGISLSPRSGVQRISTEVSRDGGIRQVAGEVETVRETEEVSSSTIPAKNRPALDIAKQIHRAFKGRAELENVGPNGLPAFVVREPQDSGLAGETQFVMEIDSDNNQLLITATPKVQVGLEKLVEQIDVNPISGKKMPTLLAGDQKMVELSKRLKRPLSLISRSQTKTLGATTPKAEEPNPFELPAPPPAKEIAQVPNVQPQAFPGQENTAQPGSAMIPNPQEGVLTSDLIGILKGDVTIEALDDLDLIIIRGNQADVDAVMKVIQRIEELAIGSLPEITLHSLDFIDSQSLAELLNDMYEQLSELRSDNAQQNAASVNVLPVVTPNAVLILAPQNTMESIIDLIVELDQPVDPTHEVEVFRLQHAIADSVVEILEGFYEEQEGLGTRLKVAADPRTNSVIVQARPRDLTEIAAVIKKIDADEAASVSQMKLYQLKNALADELAEFLNSAIQSVSDPRASTVGQTQNNQFQQQQQQTDPKSVVLEFLAEDGKELARSGLLDGIRFNAETRTNSLAVTAPKQSLPLIEELINILDRPSKAVADIKYFQLQRADATDAADLLNEIFQADDTANNDEGALGVQLAGAMDTSSALLQPVFTADTRTNSVIARGGADALIIAENLLYRLDATDSRSREFKVIKLLNAPAEDVANAINTFLQAQRDLVTSTGVVSATQMLDQEIIVTPELVSNTLLISATPNYFPEIERMAKQLDAELAQVVIQALLVEVTLDNNDEFGVELGFQDPLLFDRSVLSGVQTIQETIFDAMGNPQATNTRIISSEADPGFNFPNNALGSNAINPSSVGSQGFSNFAVGRTNESLGYGGLVLSASSESVNVLIRALAARRSVRVLSRPTIQALDNQLAQIQVGQVVPVNDGTVVNQNTTTQNVLRDPAGIILTVTPRISPQGQIVMELVAEKSSYTTEGVVISTDTSTGTVITSPVKNISTAQTTVKVPDGQTIVVGGMITDSEDIIERKVPWLGDLPILGKAFRFDSQATQRTELLIFLTPRVVKNGAISEEIKQIEADRLHFIQEVAEEIHGPLFGIPSPTEVLYEGQTLNGVQFDELPTRVIIPENQAAISPVPVAPEPPVQNQ